jgi:hypothetical protein
MEKLEDNDDEEIDIKQSQIIIDQNEDYIIKNTLDKLNKDQTNDLLINELSECYRSKKKLERLEDSLIKKIFEKFSIKEKIDENDPIDFVYTFDKSSNKSVFLINLEIIRNYLPFLRNIIIITTIPQYFYEFYANDNKIFVIQIDNIEKYKKMTNDLHNIYLLYFLKDLNYLSNIFFYANSECTITQPMKKSDIFEIKINMAKKTLSKDKNSAEYNANLAFEKKFGIFNQLTSINQVNFVRKDVIIMMSRLFKIEKYPIDYLSLQYLIGFYFKIYDIELKNHNASGFYQFTNQYPYERFNIKSKYFCVQYMNTKIFPYYLKNGLIHLGILENHPISKIILIGQKIKYILPELERIIGDLIKLVLINKEDRDKYNAKIGENIFIVDNLEKIEVNTIMLKINCESIDKILPDILYFANIYLPHKKEYESDKYKNKNDILEVIIPKSITKLFGYGDTTEEKFGVVRQGFIEFINKK